MHRYPFRNCMFAVVALNSAALAPSPARAQVDSTLESIRSVLTQRFERNREMDLAFLDAMPDSAWRWAPTPDVRDYAEQMAHTTHNFFAPWRDDFTPPDTARLLNDRTLLRAELGAGYDWAIDRLRSLSHAQLLAEQPIGQNTPPLWRVMMYWLDHALWTRGQLVPYLRIHGVDPPGVLFF